MPKFGLYNRLPRLLPAPAEAFARPGTLAWQATHHPPAGVLLKDEAVVSLGEHLLGRGTAEEEATHRSAYPLLSGKFLPKPFLSSNPKI